MSEKESKRDIIAELQSKSPEHASRLIEIQRLHQKKLYYQLSRKLSELIDISYFKEDNRLYDLYLHFINKFAKKLNQLDLVQFTIAASKQHTENSLQFLQEIAKLVEVEEQPSVLIRMEMARCHLRAKQFDEAKVLLEEGKKRMDDFMGIMDAVIHSHFYHASMLYAQAKNKHADYFQNCVLFLTYTPLEKIPPAEQLEFGRDVSIAALLGETIYNFGELLQQPILKVLSESKSEWSWLPDLLYLFNRGDVLKFSSLVSDKKVFQPILSKHGAFLQQKLKIMAFMDMALGRNSEKRKLEFKEISERIDVKINEIELIVMKSFSLNVARGVIDQVDQAVTVKWVQPRVLEKQQITVIRDRLKTWTKEIDTTARYLETNAPELLLPST